MSKKNDGLIAIIRIRGAVDQTKQVKHGLNLLNINKPNHACVVPND
ncbi:MAG: uL30 family ribosomal protein, partial [Candidatus Heimdallarchaeota archaeon]